MTKQKKLLFIIIGIGLLVYMGLPQLRDFRHSAYGSIVPLMIIGAVAFHLTFSPKIRMPLLGKITIWGFVILEILSCVLNLGKIEALFFYIYSIINILVTAYLYLKTGKKYQSIWLFGAYSYIITTKLVIRVEYINDAFAPTFLLPSVIVSVIAFVLCFVYGLKCFLSYRDVKKLILVPLAGLLGGFVLTWLTAESMNVYLDPSDSVYEEFVVIDKNVRHRRRGIDYEFKVQDGDNAFYLDVSEKTYCDYEINDTIILSLCDGAFGEPYYIYENVKE